LVGDDQDARRQQLLQMILDDDDDELMEEPMNDEEEDEFIIGMYQYALHIDKYLNRAEYRTPRVTGVQWVHDKLHNIKSCYNCLE
jgi:hypothetical protein